MRSAIITFIVGGALIASAAAPGRAEESYPWCAQGEVLHCYYETREQCELTVDYRGFCVANPEAPPVRSERPSSLARGPGVRTR